MCSLVNVFMYLFFSTHLCCEYLFEFFFVFFFKQKTAYEMRISDWSSDVCSSDLRRDRSSGLACRTGRRLPAGQGRDERHGFRPARASALGARSDRKSVV